MQQPNSNANKQIIYSKYEIYLQKGLNASIVFGMIWYPVCFISWRGDLTSLYRALYPNYLRKVNSVCKLVFNTKLFHHKSVKNNQGAFLREARFLRVK